MVCHQNSKGVLMQPVESDVNPGIDPLAVYLGLVPGFGLISFHYWNGRKQVGFHQGLPPSPHPSTPSFWDMYILRMSKKPAHHIHTYLHLPPLSLPVCTSRDIAKRCRQEYAPQGQTNDVENQWFQSGHQWWAFHIYVTRPGERSTNWKITMRF